MPNTRLSTLSSSKSKPIRQSVKDRSYSYGIKKKINLSDRNLTFTPPTLLQLASTFCSPQEDHKTSHMVLPFSSTTPAPLLSGTVVSAPVPLPVTPTMQPVMQLSLPLKSHPVFFYACTHTHTHPYTYTQTMQPVMQLSLPLKSHPVFFYACTHTHTHTHTHKQCSLSCNCLYH